MLEREKYELMKQKYSHVGSWAIWGLQGAKPKSNTDNMSWVRDPDLLLKINTGYVFVGLNWSRGDISYGGQIPWANFHSGSPHQNDFKLRYALRETKYWGSYITDVIKLYSEPDSSKVKTYIRQHPEVVEENIKEFVDEITILGENNTLIALGNDVYDILNKWLGNDYRIIKIMHYSNHISKEEYKDCIMETLSSYQ